MVQSAPSERAPVNASKDAASKLQTNSTGANDVLAKAQGLLQRTKDLQERMKKLPVSSNLSMAFSLLLYEFLSSCNFEINTCEFLVEMCLYNISYIACTLPPFTFHSAICRARLKLSKAALLRPLLLHPLLQRLLCLKYQPYHLRFCQ